MTPDPIVVATRLLVEGEGARLEDVQAVIVATGVRVLGGEPLSVAVTMAMRDRMDERGREPYSTDDLCTFLAATRLLASAVHDTAELTGVAVVERTLPLVTLTLWTLAGDPEERDVLDRQIVESALVAVRMAMEARP